MTAACVIGHCVGYSRSPALFGYWLRTLGLTGRYDLVDIAPAEFVAFFAHLGERGYVGANVTKPHKAAAFRLVAGCDAAARAVGAVNAVWFDDRRLVGSNTDVEGFLANLDAAAPGWDQGRGHAVVLGAGGAGRAVVHGLRTRGLEVAVANRTAARAEALVRHFGAGVWDSPWPPTPQLLGGACLVVNATVLGAVGQDALAIDLAGLGTDAVVCDLNYVPLESDLLRAAQQRGHRTADGLGMLMRQAVPAFERWFGARPAVTPGLRAALEADLRREDR